MKKRYLNVSYEDRHLAKRLGAQWDPSVRRWYCVADSALSKIFDWRKEAVSAMTSSSVEVINSAAQKHAVQTTLVRRPSFSERKQGLNTKPKNLELFA